jgi:plasmid stabilization system protein ParE
VPHVIITESAAQGLGRCRRFLAVKAPEAAKRAGQAIERQFLLLETVPDIGRPFPEMPWLRELVIAFGDSGYVALYRYEPASNAVYILAFRHQKEVGYFPTSDKLAP